MNAFYLYDLCHVCNRGIFNSDSEQFRYEGVCNRWMRFEKKSDKNLLPSANLTSKKILKGQISLPEQGGQG